MRSAAGWYLFSCRSISRKPVTLPIFIPCSPGFSRPGSTSGSAFADPGKILAQIWPARLSGRLASASMSGGYATQPIAFHLLERTTIFDRHDLAEFGPVIRPVIENGARPLRPRETEVVGDQMHQPLLVIAGHVA